jgi:hypothetical protein
MDEIRAFPPTPPPDTPEKPSGPWQTPPFHSGLWDVRLSKMIKSRRVHDLQTWREISDQISQLMDASSVRRWNEVIHAIVSKCINAQRLTWQNVEQYRHAKDFRIAI